MKNERYYYSIMLPDARRVYRKIFDGLKMRACQIEVPTVLSSEQVQEVYLRVLYDNPLFYYVNQTVIRILGQPGLHLLLPEYLYSQQEIYALNRDLRRVVDRVGVKARTMLSNEFRLEKYLHDSVVKSVAYDYESLRQRDCYNAHSIIGAFLENRAVCEGIAKAFKLLCNAYAIKCIVVLGKADPGGQFTGDCYHAWNLVKVQNQSYHVDPTWDNLFDRGVGPVSYDYFNVTTADIQKDHQPIGDLPYCSAVGLNYFHATKSIVRTFQELVDLICRRVDASLVTFKADSSMGEFLTAETLHQQTAQAVGCAFQKLGRGRTCALAFNDMHRIGKIFFDPPEAAGQVPAAPLPHRV